jgi:hypothetical protein
MLISTATRDYEGWVGRQIPLVRDQLAVKHKEMEQERLEFLRGTCYRWAQTWAKVCPSLADAIPVLAVGDLHVASYGTWRDRFGRLVWGVDDFDEACEIPYPSDLVRLATSAVIDGSDNGLTMGVREICEEILDGYKAGLEGGGRPFVLEERYKWLRAIALKHLDEPEIFWKKLDALPAVRKDIPTGARKALEKMLPQPRPSYRVVRRIAGTGSLGHPRYVAIADWDGGHIALEAKEAVRSCFAWAASVPAEGISYQKILASAVRSPDPFVRMEGRWLVRRLAPDSSPIEIESLGKYKQVERLLHAMGWETANIHLGSRAARGIPADLRKRPAAWFRSAVKDMTKAVTSDWKDWKESRRRG